MKLPPEPRATLSKAKPVVTRLGIPKAPIPPKTRSPIFHSPIKVNRPELSLPKPLDDTTDEKLERGSTSDFNQMANFDRFASQTIHEFNDQYSRPDDVDAHDSDDAYDPYAPVETGAQQMFFPKDPKQYFRGLCYAFLKSGHCNRLDCTFHNSKYTYHLQNLPKAQPVIIEMVLNYAIAENYFHLLDDIYPEAVKKLEMRPITRVCTKIYGAALKLKTKAMNYSAKFYQNAMKATVDALVLKGQSPLAIINVLSGCFLLPNDDDIRKKLMRVLISTNKIPPGMHWDTFKGLIKQLDGSSPVFVIRKILDDCFRFDKPREYLQDIYENVLMKISEPVRMELDQGLLRPFKQFSQFVELREDCNPGNTTPMPDLAEDFDVAREQSRLPVVHNNYSIASPEDVRDSGRYKEPDVEKLVPEIRRKSVKERLGHRVMPVKPRNMREEPLDLIPIGEVIDFL